MNEREQAMSHTHDRIIEDAPIAANVRTMLVEAA